MTEKIAQLELPRKLGRYRLLGKLGQGELGSAYLAEHDLIKRKVVLKFLTVEDEAARARFRREAQALAALDHPGIQSIHDMDEFEGHLFLVADYHEGKDIGQTVSAEKRLCATVALKLMIAVTDALSHLHKRGIIHGDIKPADIIVRSNGKPVLVGVGISTETNGPPAHDGPVTLGLRYMSPEMACCGDVDERSDLWSLGAILFHMLTGRPPYETPSAQSFCQQLSAADPPDLSALRKKAPEPVAQIVERCLQKDPEKRYASAIELRRELEAALTYTEIPQAETVELVAIRPGRSILLDVEHTEEGIPGPYREFVIHKLVGSGGYGVVYRATDVMGGREVALKVLREEATASGAAAARFHREAAILSRIHHPNIVRVRNFGLYGARSFIVMQFLKGPNMARAIQDGLSCDVQGVAAIIVQVLEGLCAIHRARVVHRDIKPGNIVLESDRVVIMDFGMAHLTTGTQITASGQIAGTPGYLAPEQARGETVTPAVDLYATGVVLYELLSGHLPHEHDSTFGLIHKIGTEPPEPITTYRKDLPGAMLAFLEKILAHDPADRFTSARQTIEALLDSAGLQPESLASVYHRIASGLGAP